MAVGEFDPGFFTETIIKDVDQLVTFWSEAEAGLVAAARDPELAALIGAGSSNLPAVERRISELMRTVNTELVFLEARTAAWADATVGVHVGAGSAAAMSAVEGAGLTIGGALGVANTATIRRLMDEIIMDAEFATNSSRRTMRRHFRATQQTLITEAAINESLLISEARLENANQRAKRLTRIFEQRAGAGQLINVNGTFFRPSVYGEIIARTRLAEAAIDGSFQTTLAMGIDTVRVTDHGKTDHFCDPHAGKVYSVSGRDKRFPRLKKRPPFHPRCRHGLLPFVPELKTDREMQFAMARSQDRIEAGVSFEEFFRNAA